MKSIVLFLALLFCISSCYNEVDVEAEWRDIPVVWGFLARQDTAHYIRIEKAFLTDNNTVFKATQLADSLYHEQVNVLLVRNSTGEGFELQKVDGNLEGYPRQAGIFATEPNYLYKIKSEDINLVAGERMSLNIINKEGETLASANTVILGDMEITSGLREDTLIQFKSGVSNRLIWETGEGGELFDLKFIIHVEEQVNGEWVTQTLDWSVARNLEPNISSKMRHAFPGIRFFQFLLNELDSTQFVLRRMKGVDLLISAGGQEFVNNRTYNLSNQYITGSETVPFYTNIAGGRGLFTSRSHLKIENLQLTLQTLDYLRNHESMEVLNFQ